MNKINLKKFIPYGKQFIDRQDISTVGKALQGKLITTGEFVKKFENENKKRPKTYTKKNKHLHVNKISNISSSLFIIITV